jgi:hypothetical protein
LRKHLSTGEQQQKRYGYRDCCVAVSCSLGPATGAANNETSTERSRRMKALMQELSRGEKWARNYLTSHKVLGTVEAAGISGKGDSELDLIEFERADYIGCWGECGARCRCG